MAHDPDEARLESDVAPASPDIPYARPSPPLSYESMVGSNRPSRWVQLASMVCLVLLMTLAGAWLLGAIVVIVAYWR
jgi:hypothetical protein